MAEREQRVNNGKHLQVTVPKHVHASARMSGNKQMQLRAWLSKQERRTKGSIRDSHQSEHLQLPDQEPTQARNLDVQREVWTIFATEHICQDGGCVSG